MTGALSLLCDFRLLQESNIYVCDLVPMVLPDNATPNYPNSNSLWKYTTKGEGLILLKELI